MISVGQGVASAVGRTTFDGSCLEKWSNRSVFDWSSFQIVELSSSFSSDIILKFN